jgi:hypothetical protein
MGLQNCRLLFKIPLLDIVCLSQAHAHKFLFTSSSRTRLALECFVCFVFGMVY